MYCSALSARRRGDGHGLTCHTARFFSLCCLGLFELSGPDGAVPVTSKKVAAPLAFLACTAPRPHARDRLATLLWGSHFDAQARLNLGQALTRLRRILGDDDAGHQSSETVALRPGVVASDVARFEALLSSSGDCLQEAVGLYGGRPARRYVDRGGGLDRMAGSRAAASGGPRAGCHGEVGRAGARAARPRRKPTRPPSGPWPVTGSLPREDAHRLMMRALRMGGRRADAFKHYDRIAALLKRELKVDPDTATVALAGKLRETLRPWPDIRSISLPESEGPREPCRPTRRSHSPRSGQRTQERYRAARRPGAVDRAFGSRKELRRCRSTGESGFKPRARRGRPGGKLQDLGAFLRPLSPTRTEPLSPRRIGNGGRRCANWARSTRFGADQMTPMRILETAFAFRASKVLMTAVELGSWWCSIKGT